MNDSVCPDFLLAVEREDVSRLINRAARVAARMAPDALKSILGLGWVGQVHFSKVSSSACIFRMSAGYVISFNPDFARNELWNDLNFSYVLCHELAHLCLGHLEPDDWSWGADGDGSFLLWNRIVKLVACEMQVSRFLHEIWRQTPGIEYRRVGQSLTGALSTTPEVLLAERWQVGDVLSPHLLRAVFSQRMPVETYEDASNVDRLAHVYAQVWGVPSMSLEALVMALAPILPREQVAVEVRQDEFQADPSCLCDHRCTPGWELVTNGRAWRAQGTDVFEPRQPGSMGAGIGDVAADYEVNAPRDPFVFRRLIAAMESFVSERVIPRGTRSSLRPEMTSPVAQMIGRRELFWLSAGATPILFPRGEASRLPEPVPIRVYVDVSGSTEAYWRSCLDALVEVLAKRPIEMFQFSNQVLPMNASQTTQAVRTTGGTDFDCVVDHALTHPPAAKIPVLIMTDGYGKLDAVRCKKAHRAGLIVAILLLRRLHEPDQYPFSKASNTWSGDAAMLTRIFSPLLQEKDILFV